MNPTVAKLHGSVLRKRLAEFKVEAGDELDDRDVRLLLTLASRLSLSTEEDESSKAREHGEAYGICACLLELFPARLAVWKACFYILSRMGNFPGVDLLSEKHRIVARLGSFDSLSLESVARRTENEVTLGSGGVVTFTDFQHRLYRLLAEGHNVSFSAPTSAGKSFVLALDVVRLFRTHPECVIVYIVPTRALIRQVSVDLSEAITKNCSEDFSVLTAPVLPQDGSAPSGTVYVLTQERYMTLLFPNEGTPRVDYLIVDEAHELRKPDRGMVLHSAITATRQRFPRARIVFSCPLASNPDFFFEEFPMDEPTFSFIEHASPVEQNLVFLSSVKMRPYVVDVRLFKGGEHIGVGRAQLHFEFRDKSLRLALAAYHFTRPGETSIVFSNRPKDAQSLALDIANCIESVDPAVGSAVSPLIDFIKDHVHPDYLLLDLLPKGVAYHYGDMPSLVRTQIENLVKNGVIKFVCCTSTLLQGVNLPAQNIFIQTPRETAGVPLSTADFWNLAGRAGRLRKNFSGNVWCLEVEKWENSPEKGERLSQVQSAFRESLTAESEKILELSKDRNLRTSGSTEEQAFSKVFAEFTLEGRRVADSNYATQGNFENLKALDATCALMKTEIHAPRAILEKNSSISPWCLERLYQRFMQADDIEQYIPIHPNQGKGETLKKIFRTIDECLLGKNNDSYTFFGWIATGWMLGEPLIKIFSSRIGFLRKKRPELWDGKDERDVVNDEIRKTLHTLEKDIHFTYVRYTRAYLDLLIVALRARSMDSLADRVLPIHIYLEFGSCDEVVLAFISLGLSRTTALLLRRALAKNWPAEMSKASLRERLIAANYRMHLPQLCVEEIDELVFGGTVRINPSH